jgi:predicted  nucleic acid-binding Zn-ribbon protein
MIKNIRLLEDRVAKVVERLKQLSDERVRLAEELQALRQQVAFHEEATEERDGGTDWQAQRTEAVAIIREALSELRAEGDPAP